MPSLDTCTTRGNSECPNPVRQTGVREAARTRSAALCRQLAMTSDLTAKVLSQDYVSIFGSELLTLPEGPWLVDAVALPSLCTGAPLPGSYRAIMTPLSPRPLNNRTGVALRQRHQGTKQYAADDVRLHLLLCKCHNTLLPIHHGPAII